jgi:hypothetical protein
MDVLAAEALAGVLSWRSPARLDNIVDTNNDSDYAAPSKMAFEDFEIRMRPMTVDDVFAVLMDITAPQAIGAAATSAMNDLSLASTVEEWELCLIDDDINWRSAFKSFNALFGIAVPGSEWKRVLSRRATLGDICELVSRHALMPVIEPVTVMTDRSRAAGAFLVVRRILQQEGVDVTELRPSSLIGPYFRENLDEIFSRLRLLAPGLMPHPTVVAPAQSACAAVLAACWVGSTLGCLRLIPPLMTLVWFAGGIASFIAMSIVSRTVKPVDVRIGTARTFRDLCEVLIGERLAFPGFPVMAMQAAPPERGLCS